MSELDKSEKSPEDWWIEIRTANPSCIYYFGAFESFTAAALSQYGYILDLLTESAKILSAEIKQCQPEHLTVVIENEAEQPSRNSQSQPKKTETQQYHYLLLQKNDST